MEILKIKKTCIRIHSLSMQPLDLYKPDSLLAKLKLVFLRAREMKGDRERPAAGAAGAAGNGG